MVRNRKPQTSCGQADGEQMKAAVMQVRNGRSIREVAIEYEINRTTLSRYLRRAENVSVEEVDFTPQYSTRKVRYNFP